MVKAALPLLEFLEYNPGVLRSEGSRGLKVRAAAALSPNATKCWLKKERMPDEVLWYFNGEWVPHSQVLISSEGRGFNGDTIFDSLPDLRRQDILS